MAMLSGIHISDIQITIILQYLQKHDRPSTMLIHNQQTSDYSYWVIKNKLQNTEVYCLQDLFSSRVYIKELNFSFIFELLDFTLPIFMFNNHYNCMHICKEFSTKHKPNLFWLLHCLHTNALCESSLVGVQRKTFLNFILIFFT